MGKIVAFLNMTLDGVMQGPASPDEDTRGGFQHGGWAAPYGAMQSDQVGGFNFGALLLGRRTYESLYGFWPHQPNNPMTEMLNAMPKYVASTTLESPLLWQNSILLGEDLAASLNEVKAQSEHNMMIMGSGNLLQSLTRDRLVDAYLLLIHPVVLGAGFQLPADGEQPLTLKLVDLKQTDKGVIVATYHPA